jgi:hypothetical protein
MKDQVLDPYKITDISVEFEVLAGVTAKSTIYGL